MNTPTIEAQPDDVMIRNSHLSHEASVRSIGSMYFLAAFFACLGAIAGIFDTKDALGLRVLIAALLMALACVYLRAGLWLRALDRRGRTPATVLSALGLVGFPLGTLINGYFLYLLQSRKGRMVFSEEYQGVIARTPQIRYRTSVLVWVLLGVLVLALGVFLTVAILSSRS